MSEPATSPTKAGSPNCAKDSRGSSILLTTDSGCDSRECSAAPFATRDETPQEAPPFADDSGHLQDSQSRHTARTELGFDEAEAVEGRAQAGYAIALTCPSDSPFPGHSSGPSNRLRFCCTGCTRRRHKWYLTYLPDNPCVKQSLIRMGCGRAHLLSCRQGSSEEVANTRHPVDRRVSSWPAW